MTRLRNHFDRELILLLIFSIFAVAALLSPGFFFRAHDADHTVFYLIEFDASIRDGINKCLRHSQTSVMCQANLGDDKDRLPRTNESPGNI